MLELWRLLHLGCLPLSLDERLLLLRFLSLFALDTWVRKWWGPRDWSRETGPTLGDNLYLVSIMICWLVEFSYFFPQTLELKNGEVQGQKSRNWPHYDFCPGISYTGSLWRATDTLLLASMQWHLWTRGVKPAPRRGVSSTGSPWTDVDTCDTHPEPWQRGKRTN